jgi:uncharacterized protein (DUF433 family)/transposase
MCHAEHMAVAVSLMERPVYTYPQVDRLLSLTGGTAKRWLNGYRRNRIVYPPILRPKPIDTRWVTWGEFVETRLFAGYRDVDNIPVQRMRRVVEVLREEFDQKYPLAYSGPFVQPEGRRMLYQAQYDAGLPNEFAVEVGTDQVMLAPWVTKFVDSVQYEAPSGSVVPLSGSAVTALQPDPDFPDVVTDPLRRSGEPVISGRNVRAATLASLVRGGEHIEDVAGWYDMSIDQVRQALQYDQLHPRIA